MSKHHESIQGERVAIAWHSLWALLCFSDYAACVFVFAQVMPLYSEGWRVAWLLWTLLGQALFATGGALWHVVAALEHRREVRRMRRVIHVRFDPSKTLPRPEWFDQAVLRAIRKGFQRGGIVPGAGKRG